MATPLPLGGFDCGDMRRLFHFHGSATPRCDDSPARAVRLRRRTRQVSCLVLPLWNCGLCPADSWNSSLGCGASFGASGDRRNTIGNVRTKTNTPNANTAHMKPDCTSNHVIRSLWHLSAERAHLKFIADGGTT